MSSDRRRAQVEFELVEHTRIRQAIGDRTLQSVNEIPQFRVQKMVLAHNLVAFRTHLKQSGADPLPTYNDILIKLAATALTRFPRLNAWHSPEGLQQLQSVNIGLAVDTEQGVLLPTVRDAGTKSLAEVAAETRELVSLARSGKLRVSLQMGAGFTISNIGPIGIDLFDAIISPPQTGILAVGSILARPVADDGQVVVRDTMWLSLTIDHRSVDGADGARFVAELAQTIEQMSPGQPL